MKEAFAIVRPACDFAGVLSDDAAISVVGGRLEAFNNELMVSHPCDLPEFCVASSELDFALRKVTDPKVNVTASNVTLTGGGTTRVPLLPTRKAFVKPDIETNKIADIDDLVSAIEEVYPFTIGDPARPWSEGARFDDTTVTATNSIMLCQAELGSSSGFEGITLSRTALAYILQRREALKAWGVSERGVLLEFDDGGWALVSRMAMEMPDAAVSLICNAVNDWSGMQDVDEDYRAAFMKASEWGSEVLQVHPDHVLAMHGKSEHDEPATTNLGDFEGHAIFENKSLTTVVSSAATIGFDRYPGPVPFTTQRGSRGLIAGRTS